MNVAQTLCRDFSFLLVGFYFIVGGCNQPVSTQKTNAEPQNQPQSDTTEPDSETVSIAFNYNQLGDSARDAGDFQGALALYRQSMDSALVDADSFGYYDSKLDVACVYDRLNELPKAIELGLDVLDAYGRSGDTVRIGRAYSTLGAFYSRAKVPDKQLAYSQKGFEMLRNHGSLIERCAAYNQMAFTHSDAGRWDAALPLLDSALLLLRASGVLDQEAALLLNIGGCHRKLGHLGLAKTYLLQAEHLSDSLGQRYVKAAVLNHLSQLSEKTGDYPQALAYYRQSVTIKDTLFTHEKERNIQEMEAFYGSREKENELSLLRAQRDSEAFRMMLIMAVISALLVISGILGWRWREKLKITQDENRKNSRRLLEFANLLRSKNSQLLEMEAQVDDLKKIETALPQNSSDTLSDPEEFTNFLYNSRILTDADWELFKNYFDLSNPGFRYRLRNKFPELTNAEERLTLLIQLGFNNQEIAATLGISKESVKKGRQRLRKRFELDTDASLEQFVHTFSSGT